MSELGTVVNQRYRLERVLGRGGMGTVYLATTSNKQPIALKAMTVATGDAQERRQAVAQFWAEARLLAKLQHPNLVRVRDAFEHQGCHYLAMDYIDGMTLARAVKKFEGFFPLPQVLDWAKQLCEVLHYLHTREPAVIFRDLKPSNIMVDRSYRLRLIDFGIARVFSDGTQTQTFIKGVGSAGYAPLEQYGAGTTDPRSDIYSLGATLYTLLCKEVPPPVVSVVAGVEAVRSLRSLNPEVPGYLEAVVGRMMALRKEQRFDSVADAARALLEPPEDEEDPTGTLELAQRRAATAQLGPCLVCKRVGPEAGPFQPEQTPLAMTRVEPNLPVTLVIGLKSEPDPQSGLHFQRGQQTKHAASNIDLGFRGAAVLVACDESPRELDGEKLLQLARKELVTMAEHLIENFVSLPADMQLAAVPVLEDMAVKELSGSRRLPILQLILQACRDHLDPDSEAYFRQHRRLADLLHSLEKSEQAAPHYRACLSWLANRLEELTSQGHLREAIEVAQQQHECEQRAGLDTFKTFEQLLELYRKSGRSIEELLQQRLRSADGIEKAQLWLDMARALQESGDREGAERQVSQALALAEQHLEADDPALHPYLALLAELQEELRRPQAADTKTRALILKYKR